MGKAGYTENNFPPNLEAYSQQEEILQDRNSYSRTDPDATFIADEEWPYDERPIEAWVQYNDQHQANDIHKLKSYLASHHALCEELPAEIIADAGYGSEGHYAMRARERITVFLKCRIFKRSRIKNDRNVEINTSLEANKEIGGANLLSTIGGKKNATYCRCRDNLCTVKAQLKLSTAQAPQYEKLKKFGIHALAHTLKKKHAKMMTIYF